MIKRLTRGAIIAIAAVMLLLPFCKVSAGIPVGTWRAHPAYNDATFSLKAFGYICVLSDGAIYFYDPADQALYTIDKTGGLGDTDIASMGYCNSEKAVVLVYSNGNIDLLYDDFTIYNFTDIKNNSTGSVSVNELKIAGSKAYISTSIGLIIFDIKKRVIENTYRFDTPVLTSLLTGDSLFCATETGVYMGRTSVNLLDNANWKLFSNYQFTDLFEFDGKLSGRLSNRQVYTINKSTASLSHILDYVDGLSILSSGQLVMIQDSIVNFYNSYSDHAAIDFHSHVNHVLADDNDLWLCQGVNGLCQYSFQEEGLVCYAQGIKPNSPRRNWFHSVSWPQSGKLLAVGGCQNYSGIDYPGTVMIYENDRWSFLDEDITSKTGLKYVNLTEAVQDPDDPNHIFAGSTGHLDSHQKGFGSRVESEDLLVLLEELCDGDLLLFRFQFMC